MAILLLWDGLRLRRWLLAGDDMKILLIDRGQEARNLLEKIILGCKVDWVLTIEEALRKTQTEVYDLVITEVDLPDGSGLSLLEKLKSESLPIAKKTIFFSALAGVEIRRKALALGAVDFIAKPVDPNELGIRILSRVDCDLSAAQMKARMGAASPEPQVSVNFGSLEIQSTDSGKTTTVSLTATEFKLFHFLYLQQGKIIDRDTIRKEVWKSNPPNSYRSIDKHIATLRKRLEPTVIKIKTINKYGYGLVIGQNS